MIDTFEAVNGVHPGFRRNHAKGVCLAGVFDSNGAGAPYSSAEIFKPSRVPVFGRFALAGGMPMMLMAQAWCVAWRSTSRCLTGNSGAPA
jgi:catalase